MAEGLPALGWAARDVSGHLSPYSFSRSVPKDDDVTIKVLFCGICHTDLHMIKNDWGNALYPIVPGHEIVGVVTDVGPGVNNFKAGDSRHGGRGLLPGLMPHLLQLRQGVRELLPHPGAHLQRRRRPRRHHPGRLLRRPRRQQGLRPPRPGHPAPARGRAAALRRRHRVQPHGAVRAQRPQEAPRRRRPRRARPRRRQVRQGVRDDRHRHQHLREEARGGARPPRRRRLPRQQRSRPNEGGCGHDGRHHRHGVGGAPDRAAAGLAEADGADGGGGRAEQAHGAAGLRHHRGRHRQRRRLPGHAGLRGEARHYRGR